MATVHWSKNISKNIRHLQIRENAIRECVGTKFVKVKHVGGKINLAAIFTKEEKYLSHFIGICDKILSCTFPPEVDSKTDFHFVGSSTGGVELYVRTKVDSRKPK